MLQLDGMLMIGSVASNVGKTKLACALLERFGRCSDIIGIKVTTIKSKDRRCPRGGWGCGICSSMEGDFCLVEEADRELDKDTARLLAAGASRVFWLRVMKEHLEEGIESLLDIMGPDAVCICESNSLRKVVVPGLFLIVKDRFSRRWKGSAQRVKRYADRIVISDGKDFDFDLGRIKLIDSRWILPEEATAIVMAGGDSIRMGTDKSMLPIKGRAMIEHICRQLEGTFSRILISANDVNKYAFLGFEVIPDKVPGKGPLMGIASALEASGNEHNFVVACDIPFIELSFVRHMLAEAAGSGVDIVIPIVGGEKYEPLFAVYCKSALAAINKALLADRRKISDVFKWCGVKYVELSDAKWLVNLNTMAEYEGFQKSYDGQVWSSV